MKKTGILFLVVLFTLSCGSNTDSDSLDEVDGNTPQPQLDAPISGDRVSDAQQRLRNQQQTDSNDGVSTRYALNVEPYNYFLNDDGFLELSGVSDAKLDQVLGTSPVLVRQSVEGAPIRREVRVYFPYEKDSTGLIIYIKNNRVEEFRMDTFLGLANSTIIEDYFQN
ncbi:MAG: hypothetical protein JJU41_01140 [Bacteroidetes bacterium]|nr:hypothetical protein [Bacteroidota bacterium]MCH8522978.1 hypothetical protein [Balneolales bacterium]